ncbi:unnamed protein product [Urochloa humidicola]
MSRRATGCIYLGRHEQELRARRPDGSGQRSISLLCGFRRLPPMENGSSRSLLSKNCWQNRPTRDWRILFSKVLLQVDIFPTSNICNSALIW